MDISERMACASHLHMHLRNCRIGSFFLWNSIQSRVKLTWFSSRHDVPVGLRPVKKIHSITVIISYHFHHMGQSWIGHRIVYIFGFNLIKLPYAFLVLWCMAPYCLAKVVENHSAGNPSPLACYRPCLANTFGCCLFGALLIACHLQSNLSQGSALQMLLFHSSAFVRNENKQ